MKLSSGFAREMPANVHESVCQPAICTFAAANASRQVEHTVRTRASVWRWPLSSPRRGYRIWLTRSAEPRTRSLARGAGAAAVSAATEDWVAAHC